MALRKGLGKGLDALFTDNGKPEGASESKIKNSIANGKMNGSVFEIDINKIEPNRMQPRKYFDDSHLQELAESIKTFGIIQPIIVKKEGDYYSIIAGERRWRASRIAGLTVIPAVVKDYSGVEALEAALIENIQREDLNPIEEAYCYQRLISEYAFSQEQLAQRIGKNRSFISNSLRLLTLDEMVITFIIEGKLTMGHARTLIPISDRKVQLEFAEKIIDDGYSVRATEELVRDYLAKINKVQLEAAEEKKQKIDAMKSHIITTAENNLKTILGANVTIKDGKKKGTIEIEFYTPDELDRLLVMFNGLNGENKLSV